MERSHQRHAAELLKSCLTWSSWRVGCLFCRYTSRVALMALNRDTITCKAANSSFRVTFMHAAANWGRNSTRYKCPMQQSKRNRPRWKKRTHISVLMINKQIPHLFIVQVGDLQAVSMADLLRLEHRIQVLHGDDSFGNLGLRWMTEQVQVLQTQSLWTLNRRVTSNTWKTQLTSPLMKYLRVKSVLDRRNLLFTNCLFSLPFFHSVASNRSGVESNTRQKEQLNCFSCKKKTCYLI